MEAEKKKLQTWLVTCLVTWVVTKTWKILSLSMFGDIIQTLLPTCSKTFACRKLPERHSGPVSCLGMKQDLCTSNVAGIKHTIAVLIVLLLLFQNDPSTHKACFSGTMKRRGL